MNKIFTYIFATIVAAAFTSCATSYNIHGNANSSDADGGILYLKVLSPKDLEYVNLDSAEIVHGEFHFSGNVDSVRMAAVCTDRTALFPIVVEGGDVKINDSSTGLTFGGTPLNDELYGFYKTYSQMLSDLSDLDRRPTQAILNGEELDEMTLQRDFEILNMRMDSLVTGFIKANFDNVLGPGVFMLTTQNYQYPVLEPWIEDLMSKATEAFKSDAYVRMYIEKAHEIEKRLNGTIDPEVPAVMPTEAPAEDIKAAPTPNELAGDTLKSEK